MALSEGQVVPTEPKPFRMKRRHEEVLLGSKDSSDDDDSITIDSETPMKKPSPILMNDAVTVQGNQSVELQRGSLYGFPEDVHIEIASYRSDASHFTVPRLESVMKQADTQMFVLMVGNCTECYFTLVHLLPEDDEPQDIDSSPKSAEVERSISAANYKLSCVVPKFESENLAADWCKYDHPLDIRYADVIHQPKLTPAELMTTIRFRYRSIQKMEDNTSHANDLRSRNDMIRSLFKVTCSIEIPSSALRIHIQLNFSNLSRMLHRGVDPSQLPFAPFIKDKMNTFIQLIYSKWTENIHSLQARRAARPHRQNRSEIPPDAIAASSSSSGDAPSMTPTDANIATSSNIIVREHAPPFSNGDDPSSVLEWMINVEYVGSAASPAPKVPWYKFFVRSQQVLVSIQGDSIIHKMPLDSEALPENLPVNNEDTLLFYVTPGSFSTSKFLHVKPSSIPLMESLTSRGGLLCGDLADTMPEIAKLITASRSSHAKYRRITDDELQRIPVETRTWGSRHAVAVKATLVIVSQAALNTIHHRAQFYTYMNSCPPETKIHYLTGSAKLSVAELLEADIVVVPQTAITRQYRAAKNNVSSRRNAKQEQTTGPSPVDAWRNLDDETFKKMPSIPFDMVFWRRLVIHDARDVYDQATSLGVLTSAAVDALAARNVWCLTLSSLVNKDVTSSILNRIGVSAKPSTDHEEHEWKACALMHYLRRKQRQHSILMEAHQASCLYRESIVNVTMEAEARKRLAKATTGEDLRRDIHCGIAIHDPNIPGFSHGSLPLAVVRHKLVGHLRHEIQIQQHIMNILERQRRGVSRNLTAMLQDDSPSSMDSLAERQRSINAIAQDQQDIIRRMDAVSKTMSAFGPQVDWLERSMKDGCVAGKKDEDDGLLRLVDVPCPICLADSVVRPYVSLCGHYLCKDCYDACTSNKSASCPVCRVPLLPSLVFELDSTISGDDVWNLHHLQIVFGAKIGTLMNVVKQSLRAGPDQKVVIYCNNEENAPNVARALDVLDINFVKSEDILVSGSTTSRVIIMSFCKSNIAARMTNVSDIFFFDDCWVSSDIKRRQVTEERTVHRMETVRTLFEQCTYPEFRVRRIIFEDTTEALMKIQYRPH